MQVPDTFGDRLRRARRRKGLDQDALGQQVGLTGHTIGRLERGQTKQISVEALREIARVLTVTTDWLIGVPGKDEAEESQLVAPSV